MIFKLRENNASNWFNASAVATLPGWSGIGPNSSPGTPANFWSNTLSNFPFASM